LGFALALSFAQAIHADFGGTFMSPILYTGKLAEILPDNDLYTFQEQSSLEGYFKELIELRPALILVDARLEHWRMWLTTPKISPATRRIPILLLSDDAEIRAESAVHGADYSLSLADFAATPLEYLAEYARIPDSKMLEKLDAECQDGLPPLAQEGIRKFNAGEYYKQHDLFEEQWMATETPVRDLYRAILQVGIGYFQIERGNYRGALKMLQRSVQWLMLLPDVCQGVNIKKLREDSFRVRAELERLGEAGFGEFDKALIKPVEMKK
jgi:predicted metal-dependent hydrolase